MKLTCTQLFTILIFIGMGACKKSQDDPAAIFRNSVWEGTYVHAKANPVTEEPFRITFGAQDSIYYDYVEGVLAGKFEIMEGNSKLRLDLNNGQFILEATIKNNDSLVAFTGIKSGDFSFKRAGRSTISSVLPSGTWWGIYSMQSSHTITFQPDNGLMLHVGVFIPNTIYTKYSLKSGILRYETAELGKYFAIVKDTVLVGAYDRLGPERFSFLLKKR